MNASSSRAPRLRPEEAIAFAIFVPMAYALFRMIGVPPDVGGPAAGYPSSLARLVALLGVASLFFWLLFFRPQWELARDAMPFLFCANVYANLHDLIRFYGAPNITLYLYHWDIMMFGVEPSVWAERFIRPLFTDIFTFCYWLFYVLGPLLGLLLYLQRDRRGFRYTMVSVVLCLFMGYVGYVAWPATAPRLAISWAYSVPLHGWSPFLDYSRAATAAVPLTTQGAFPSLHCAVALLTLLLAWRHLRWFFWAQLPFCVGLVVGTVYLRHHWTVDILVGFVLAIAAFFAGPRIEDAWNRAAGIGVEPAARTIDSAVPTSERSPAPRREVAARTSAGGS